MKLYDTPPRTWVRFTDQEDSKAVRVPPAHREFNSDEYVFFDHLDGMYSYCKDVLGEIVHPAGWTEVDIVEDPVILENLNSLRQ